MWVIFDRNSKQWVGNVDGKFVLVPTSALSHKFVTEIGAYAIIGASFGQVPYDCTVEKVS